MSGVRCMAPSPNSFPMTATSSYRLKPASSSPYSAPDLCRVLQSCVGQRDGSPSSRRGRVLGAEGETLLRGVGDEGGVEVVVEHEGRGPRVTDLRATATASSAIEKPVPTAARRRSPEPESEHGEQRPVLLSAPDRLQGGVDELDPLGVGAGHITDAAAVGQGRGDQPPDVGVVPREVARG